MYAAQTPLCMAAQSTMGAPRPHDVVCSQWCQHCLLSCLCSRLCGQAEGTALQQGLSVLQASEPEILASPFSVLVAPPDCRDCRFSDRMMVRWLGSAMTVFSKGRMPCSSRGRGGRTRMTTCTDVGGLSAGEVQVRCKGALVWCMLRMPCPGQGCAVR